MDDLIQELFENAVYHREEHQCGAHPYKHGQKLFELTKGINPKNILEIGVGVGYSTICMALAAPEAQITSIEYKPDHIELASKNYFENGINNRVNLILADAREYLPKIKNTFDLIFFDAYDVKNKFLIEINRLSKPGDHLINANIWNRSTAEKKYLKNLLLSWELLEEFDDTIVLKKFS